MASIDRLNSIMHLYVIHKPLEYELIKMMLWVELEVHGQLGLTKLQEDGQFECHGKGKK